MSSAPSLASQFYHLGLVRRMNQWLHALPHPSVVAEIAPTHVAAARWGAARGRVDARAQESLSGDAIVASPIDANVSKPDVVRAALGRVFDRVPPRGQTLALLIPDPVVRVFILPFETLPRRAEEALPLLRWRLKKSVPFDVDETVVSWMRQSGREGNLEVVTAIARQRIVREYEEILNSLGASVGVVLSSTLAALPLLEERGSTLLARMCGKCLTTAIVQGANLCVYRSTEMANEAGLLDPQLVLDEIFPAIAYYQDTWGGSVDRARFAGFGSREETFRQALARELKCSVGSLADSAEALALGADANELIQQDLDSLVGWMMNGTS